MLKHEIKDYAAYKLEGKARKLVKDALIKFAEMEPYDEEGYEIPTKAEHLLARCVYIESSDDYLVCVTTEGCSCGIGYHYKRPLAFLRALTKVVNQKFLPKPKEIT